MENEIEVKNKKRYIYLNYKRKNKWLGIIDYKSLIVLCIYIFIVICFLKHIYKFIPIKLEYIIYLFIFFVIPVISALLININDESAVDTLIVIFKFCINNKIYVKKEYIKKLDKKIYKFIDEKKCITNNK